MNDRTKQQLIHLARNNSFTQALLGTFKEKISDSLVEYLIDRTVGIIAREATVTQTLTKAGGQNYQIYIAFVAWLTQHIGPNSNRSIVLSAGEYDYNSGTEPSVVDLGDKPVFFTYKKHIFIAKKQMDSGNRYETIVITMIGRDASIVRSLYEEFCPKIDNSQVNIFTSSHGGNWEYLARSSKRSLDTVIVKDEIKKNILDRISTWKASEEWYLERGISFKLAMILYGPPGTGKTSLIKAIASHLGYHVYILNLKHFTDTTLQRAIQQSDDKAIIVLEDVDSHLATHARNTSLSTDVSNDTEEGTIKYKGKSYTSTELAELLQKANAYDEEYSEEPTPRGSDTSYGVTLSGLLNALDGMVPINNKIIVMTTNTIETLDSALTRKGRVDCRYYIGKLEDKEVRQYIKLMYGDDVVIPTDVEFRPIAGCDLQDLYFEHRDDYTDFIENIPFK